MEDKPETRNELTQIINKLSEIKEQVVQINQKTENNYKWLAKLTRRIFPITIAVTVIEILILIGLFGITYFIVKFFVFSDVGKSILKFVSSFAK
ncbi:MAG: hypothetical protein NT145_00710 [Elusimicrobia bacterium]|nr:hypothetical protein [Elusimicrobiota bacterium]